MTYLVADGEGKAKGKVSDYNVLVSPAHLELGWLVRMSTVAVDGEEKTLGTFSAPTTADIWHIKKGASMRFFVEDEHENVRVAAVSVSRRLDLTCLSHEGVNEEASEEYLGG